jgi:hypothetical protein
LTPSQKEKERSSADKSQRQQQPTTATSTTATSDTEQATTASNSKRQSHGGGSEKAPVPENCFYEERPVFDQWSRSFNGTVPFTNMSDPLRKHPWKIAIARIFRSFLEKKAATEEQASTLLASS